MFVKNKQPLSAGTPTIRCRKLIPMVRLSYFMFLLPANNTNFLFSLPGFVFEKIFIHLFE